MPTWRRCASRERQGNSPVDGLWRHTCFEAFVGIPGAEPYYEFNFSPWR